MEKHCRAGGTSVLAAVDHHASAQRKGREDIRIKNVQTSSAASAKTRIEEGIKGSGQTPEAFRPSGLPESQSRYILTRGLYSNQTRNVQR
jgi:hypothetical protein